MRAVRHQAIIFIKIYERVDFLFVILFTVVRAILFTVVRVNIFTVVGAMELSVDPSSTFFNFFLAFLHLLCYFLLDALCVLLIDRYTLVGVIKLSVDPSLFFFSDFCHFFIFFIIFAGCPLSYA